VSSIRSINYTGKDFSSFKEQLIEFAKNYFPDSYSDFTVPSPGTMFMEMAAYVGDILSFYQDIQVQETFIQYAKNPANLYAMAYMLGYRPKITTVAETELEFRQIVPASKSIDDKGREVYQPDWSKLYKVEEYSNFRCSLQATTGFLLRDDVDFSFSSSYDPTDIYVGALDEEGNPLYYEFYKKGKVFSGELRETTFNFGTYKKFQTVELKDTNIVTIVKVENVETGEIWTEVPFLGQDTVFEEERVENREEALKDGTAYNLRLRKVDRRFTTRFNTKGNLVLQFGAGVYAEDSDEENFLPNPISLEAGTQDFVDQYDLAYDPSNFLFSKSYGLAPTNCTLKVTYIVGGGLSANVPANSITEYNMLRLANTATGVTVPLEDLTVEIDDGSDSGLVLEGLVFNNPKPAVGGRSGDTVEEIRENSLRSFAEQKRIVTLKDFNVRALSMPQKFGAISKVFAANEPLTNVTLSALARNPLAITLYVLSQDIEGHLTYASNIVKENLRTYLSQYMMITDALDIKDAYVINIGITYDIVLRPGVQTRDVLLKCNEAIQDYMKIEKRSINEPLNLSDLYTLLDTVDGVQTVKNITVANLTKRNDDKDSGRTYGTHSYDIPTATRNNVIYPSYDPCIFEVKYPNQDILGRAVTL
jgi:hypothetical protein